MLNKDKIRLMTGLAIYEKNGGNEDLKINGHYRYDYVMTQLFSAFIRYTACFAIGLVLYLVCNANDLFLGINTDGFILTLKKYLLFYLIGLLVYLVITVIVSVLRHKRAAENTQVYAEALSKLERRYHSGRKQRG